MAGRIARMTVRGAAGMMMARRGGIATGARATVLVGNGGPPEQEGTEGGGGGGAKKAPHGGPHAPHHNVPHPGAGAIDFVQRPQGITEEDEHGDESEDEDLNPDNFVL